MKQPTRIAYASQTHVGRERSQNEDATVTLHFTGRANGYAVECGLFAVSDGMGGHNAGEIASMTALKGLVSHVNQDLFQKLVNQEFYNLPEEAYNYHFPRTRPPRKPPKVGEVMLRAARKANSEIIALARKNPAFFGMGATLTAAALVGRRLTVINVGDSRCYTYQEGRLCQLTRDHTIVGQMLELGKITAEEAQRHPGKNFLYRSLGADEDLEADILEVELASPCWVLLCSDGLSNMVPDSSLLTLIRGSRDPETAARKLIRMANLAGGKDNISVVLVKVTC